MRRSRKAAIVMAITMVSWMLVQVAGGRLGWDPRLAILFDLLAGAALIWALAIVFRIYRIRRAEKD